MNKRRKTPSGQVLPYYAVLIAVLLLSWAMIINIGKLLTDRMIMQNSADNAALSAAVYKARVMNTLGYMNYLIAYSLYGTESGLLTYYKYGFKIKKPGMPVFPVPVLPMCAIDSQKKITGYFDFIANGSTGQIYATKTFVNAICKIRGILFLNYEAANMTLATGIGRRQDVNYTGKYCGSDWVTVSKGTELFLKPNKNGVVYFKPVRTYIEQIAAKAILIAAAVFFEIPDLATVDLEVYESKECGKSEESWVYAEKDEFYNNQKITVEAYKYYNNKNPIFSNLLNIKWPYIQTNASASLYIDSRFPMFPLEETGKTSDSISKVLNAYNHSKDRGWFAHLVPVSDKINHRIIH